MTYPMNRLLSLAAALVLSGCSFLGLGGGEEEDPRDRIDGNRISVLQIQAPLTVDDAVQDTAVTLPPAIDNRLWPQAGGYPSHSMSNLGLAEGELDRAFSRDIGEGSGRTRRLVAQPIVIDNVLYAMDAKGDVLAMDARDGDTLWRVNIIPRGERAESLGGGIAYADDRLFAAAGYSEVVALDPENGGLVWKRATAAPVRTAPTAVAGEVYVVTFENELLALNAEDGRPLWSHRGIPEAEGLLGGSSPAVSGDIVVVTYSSGEVYALRRQNGVTAWQDNLGSVIQAGAEWRLPDINALPVADNGRVFVAALANRLVAIDERSGARIWQREIGSLDTPAVAGDFVYVMTVQAQLVCLIAETGEIRWIADLPRFEDPEDRSGPIVWRGPVIGGGRLFLGNSEEEIYEIDATDGRVLNRYDTSDPVLISPLIAGRTLYVLSDNGELAAFR